MSEIEALVRDRFCRAVGKKSRFEPVTISATGDESSGQVRIVGRQPKEDLANLNLVVRELRLAERNQNQWAIDTSYLYFLREGTDELVRGYRFIIQAPSDQMAGVVEILSRIVDRVRPVTRQVVLTEIPIHGASPNRNISNGRSRGVKPTLG